MFGKFAETSLVAAVLFAGLPSDLSRAQASTLLEAELRIRSCNSISSEAPMIRGVVASVDSTYAAMEKIGYVKKVEHLGKYGSKYYDRMGWILSKSFPVLSQPNEVGPHTQLGFIPFEGRNASTAGQDSEAAASPQGTVYVWWGVPHVVSITGITEGAIPATRVVTYRWTYILSSEAQKLASAGLTDVHNIQSDTATFRKYDDGWRLEEASSDSKTVACQ